MWPQVSEMLFSEAQAKPNLTAVTTSRNNNSPFNPCQPDKTKMMNFRECLLKAWANSLAKRWKLTLQLALSIPMKNFKEPSLPVWKLKAKINLTSYPSTPTYPSLNLL